MNYYKHHIGDYRRDTTHLTLLEHGIYRQLIDTYYLDEMPLSNDLVKLMRAHSVRTEEEKVAFHSVLSDFFTLTDNGYTHGRCDEGVITYQAKAGVNQIVGKLGGRPKKINALENPLITQTVSENNPPITQMVSENNPPITLTNNQEPITNNHKPKNINKILKPLPNADAFCTGSAVWESYSEAYTLRYQIPPVRNAKTNAVCKQIVARLGMDAPHVASYFVNHSNSFYVTKGHSLTTMLGDCEKLRTEWMTGMRITTTSARQADRAQNTGDVFRELKNEISQGRH